MNMRGQDGAGEKERSKGRLHQRNHARHKDEEKHQYIKQKRERERGRPSGKTKRDTICHDHYSVDAVLFVVLFGPARRGARPTDVRMPEKIRLRPLYRYFVRRRWATTSRHYQTDTCTHEEEDF